MATCNDCAHFADTPVSSNNSRAQLFGQCRRFPPKSLMATVGPGSAPQTHWPRVANTDWCGEYRSK